MKSVILLIAMIGCAVATPPIVTTLYSDLNRNTLQIQPPFGGRISAELPSVANVAPILSRLAPLALSLGNLAPLGNLGSLGNLASLGNLVSLGDLASLGEIASLGARLLPALPSPLPLRTVPVSIPFPYQFTSFSPINYSPRSSVPYPYGVYSRRRLF